MQTWLGWVPRHYSLTHTACANFLLVVVLLKHKLQKEKFELRTLTSLWASVCSCDIVVSRLSQRLCCLLSFVSCYVAPAGSTHIRPQALRQAQAAAARALSRPVPSTTGPSCSNAVLEHDGMESQSADTTQHQGLLLLLFFPDVCLTLPFKDYCHDDRVHLTSM